MAVEAQAVQITIDVVDKNSAQTVGQVTKNIQSMGSAGATTGETVAAGMDKIKGHSLTALDNVRLLRDDIGIRIPRSMEKAIASSNAMMGVIGTLGGALLAVGAIDIGIRIGKGLYDAYENYLSLTKGAEDYNAEAKKAKDEDFANTKSIETTRARIDEATDAVRRLNKESEAAAHYGILGKIPIGVEAIIPGLAGIGIAQHFANRKAAADLEKQAFDAQRQLDKLQKERLTAQQHEQNLGGIDLQHAGDARLRGEQKITAELQKQREINAENARFEAQEEGRYGNTVAAAQASRRYFQTGHLDLDAGDSRRSSQDAIAQAKADADLFNLRREQTHSLEQLQEQAREAGLKGVELYKAQEAAAIDELKFKDENSVAFRNAVHAKFHAEELRRLQDETRETEKIERSAAAAGMTGVPKIQAEGANRVADITSDEALSPEARARRVAAANLEMHRQVTAAEEEFTQRVNALADESATHQISGFARIRADATKEIDALRQEYEKLYGRNTAAPEYQAHLGELNRGIGAINVGAGQQTSDLTRKNAEETSQLEAEARAKMLGAEKQQTAAFEAEYQERLQKFKEELEQQEISQDDYNRRIVAAAEMRDAQMVDAARQAREKMAGEFAQFFKNPLGSLKEFGDKAAGQAAAAVFQRVQGHFGGAGVNTNTAAPGGFLDNIMGRIAGVPHAAGSPAAHTHTSESVKAISLGTAEIHIQSANVAFGSTAAGFGGSQGAPASVPAGYGGNAIGTASQGISVAAQTPGSAGASDASSWSTSGSTVAAGGGSTGAGGGIGAAVAAGFGGAGGGNNIIGKGIGDVSQGLSLFKQAKGIFGSSGTAGAGASGSLSSGGTADGMVPLEQMQTLDVPGKSMASNGGMLGGGGIGANLGGAASGAMGLYSAYEGNGGIGGTLSGAMSGMQLGMSVGGPIGAAIGAAGGAILGAIGFGGKEKARVYDLKQVRPRLANDTEAFQQGSMDYASAYSDMQSLDQEARKNLDKMGGAARGYYWDTINGEIKRAEAKLTGEQRAGRSQFTTAAAQYETGTDRVPETGAYILHENESVYTADRTDRTEAATRALESAADSRTMPAASGFDGHVHFHVNAIDSKGVAQFFRDNSSHIRASLNYSRMFNSGGADE